MWWILAGLMLLILMSLLRAVIGPTVIDRFVAINAITSKVSVIILLLAFARGEFEYIDIALVFMLCGFVGGLWIIKVLTPSVWEFSMPRLKKTKEDGEEVTLDD
ncbi:MAG TPA: monovalent cation/H+ antiporter complex subunit F [Syntrophomonadaceae bacterium]|nr:monovalent cation/H+ antiporter complex subunit F [Syntrophomonadaceae bacterium]